MNTNVAIPKMTAGGNIHASALGGADFALAITLGTGIGNRLALALTDGAGAPVLNASKGCVCDDRFYAGAFAAGAACGLCAGLCAGTFAFVAGFGANEVNFLRAALGGFFKGEIYADTDVVALNRAGTAAAGCAACKNIEYIIKAAEPAKTAEALKTAEPAALTGLFMTKLVIAGALLGVGKHGIRFVRFLELFFRFFVAGVDVGMVLFGHLAIRPFNSRIVCISFQAKHLIIIPLCQIDTPLYVVSFISTTAKAGKFGFRAVLCAFCALDFYFLNQLSVKLLSTVPSSCAPGLPVKPAPGFPSGLAC